MNYYNPYFMPITRPSLFSTLGSSLSFSRILNGTQRTLNIINQAIPIVKQVSPAFKNVKTMFKVMNEFKKVDMPKNNNVIKKESSENYEGPKFFA